ncbi:phosphoribosylformylglycinamidine synthase subunit PurL [bacterium]|nr:MAG: phosphoribosylformylglycinamidine synthase subunit PurL [bacterium]
MAALKITPEVYTSMGLNDGEYALLLELLGREPSYTELGMFAVMWSEHCGYKYSRPVLGYFKNYREAMEGGGLENAGVVDIGDGIGITFKVESHNHPSAVEPYQGAATGVGGIIRDILTMGARPIAGLNSLRFGPIQDGAASAEIVAHNRYLFEHVVEGISGYGNCVGVPTVAGEVNFHPRYSGNPLVNAMCIGVLRNDQITTAAASGIGNPVLYLGSATGKDGIHGATFASVELDEASESKRPNVQIGDPFAEKIVIEATLEALATGAIVAIQDMGAAGLTCSTVEMASKGSVGMEVDLDLVPMRESDMTGYELMLSESQERMFCVAEKGREQEVIDVFQKWGTHAVVVGHVTDDGLVTIRRHGVIEAQLDPKLLTDHCPVYTSKIEEPEYHRAAANFVADELEEVDLSKALIDLLSHPDVASKRWVFSQYDQQVQTLTVRRPGEADAAVLALRGTKKGIATKIDGNARITYLDPYNGGRLAVLEAARNVACTGAKPLAVTDGLNFGSPQEPHVYWQFDRAVKGIADASAELGLPVVSGNVSFYNESEIGEVPPTALIGIVGLLEDASKSLPSAPPAGTVLALLSTPQKLTAQGGLGASLFLSTAYGIEDGLPEPPDVAGENRLFGALVEGAASGELLSAHDTSEGGLALALAEIALISGGVAATVPSVDPSGLYGEVPGRVIVGVRDFAVAKALADRYELGAFELGTTDSSDKLSLKDADDREMNWGVPEMRDAYEGTIPALMKH